MKLIDSIELAAILAGLRMLQRAMLDENAPIPPDIWDIATNGETQHMITDEGIDRLCDLLNRPDELRT